MTYQARFRVVAALFFVALLVFAVPQAQAADVNVNCPNGGGGSYASITDALNAIGPVGPHNITVTGICKENVYLFNASLIAIRASAPGGATVNGSSPDYMGVFEVDRSWGISLVDLDILSDGQTNYGVAAYNHSQVTINRCNIHDAGGGVYVSQSDLNIRRSTIQNSLDALDVYNDSTVSVNGSTLQNNIFGGVYLQNHSSVSFGGQNFILNNGDYGFQVIDLSRLSIGGDSTNFSTIQGHNAYGILLARQSVLTMGAGLIQGNGAACGPPDCGGIFATRNNTLRITGVSIRGNQGSGISVHQGADVGLLSTTISNNSGDGVRLAQISTGDFMSISGYTNNIISGNGGASVFCDQTSLALGDLSGFAKPDCKNIERSDGQVRPGRSKEPNP